MKIFANKDIKQFFLSIAVVMVIFLLISELSVYVLYKELSLPLLLLFLLMTGSVLVICFWYFNRQHGIMESAVTQIDSFLAGDTDARIGGSIKRSRCK